MAVESATTKLVAAQGVEPEVEGTRESGPQKSGCSGHPQQEEKEESVEVA